MNVTAEAFGFAGKKQAAQRDDTNFQLAPRVDVALLTSAEMDSLLPDNKDTKLLRATCTGCHNLDTILHRRGMTSEQWQSFVQNMTQDRMPQPHFSAQAAFRARPDAREIFRAGRESTSARTPIRRNLIRSSTLRSPMKRSRRPFASTKCPTAGAWTHSLTVDATRDIAWFSEYDNQSNKIGRFNIASETFQEYPVPTPRAGPHTPIVGHDGRVWMALNGGVPAKLVSVDPTTNELKQYSLAGEKAGAHTVAVAPDGNLFYLVDELAGRISEFQRERPNSLRPTSTRCLQRTRKFPPAPTSSSIPNRSGSPMTWRSILTAMPGTRRSCWAPSRASIRKPAK